VPILNTAQGSFYSATDTTDYGIVGKPYDYQTGETDPIRMARLSLLSKNGFSPQGPYGLWSVNGNTGVYLDNL